jgi:hypothetical protein
MIRERKDIETVFNITKNYVDHRQQQFKELCLHQTPPGSKYLKK